MKLTMSTGGRWLAGLGAVLALAVAAPSIAAAQETTKIEGMITARDGDTMTVKPLSGAATVVTLTPATKVVATSGSLNLQRSDMTASELLNGLPVSVEGMQNGSAFEAAKVSFKTKDLKTAQQISAGTDQAKARVRAKAGELEAADAATLERLKNANQYVEKGSATVLFATGSAVLSAKGKSDLKALSGQAQGIKGYLIGVTGFADPTGNAERNQALSERRAAAVTTYLQKFCGVQPYRVLKTNAMGDVQQVGDTSTPEGMAQNRRVEVKILTNKGLEGL